MSQSESNTKPGSTSRRARRTLVSALAAAAILSSTAIAIARSGTGGPSVQAALASLRPGGDTMVVYKGPQCDCCGEWIGVMRKAGFTVKVVDQADVSPTKDRLGVPALARSCHTAVIGGYAIEGHVPSADIARLLAERPNLAGIAVPGMPTGTPGMDGPKVPYKVLSFDKAGVLKTYAVH